MATAKSSVGLFKRACNEIPDIVGSSFMGLIGIGTSFIALYIYNKNDGNNRKYKQEYTVIRSDDPRASTVKKGPNVR